MKSPISRQYPHRSKHKIVGNTYRILLIVIIILNRKSTRWNDPTPTNRHLLRIIGTPDLDLINLSLRETLSTQNIIEVCIPRISPTIASEYGSFAAEDDFEPGDVVGWHAASHFLLDDGEDGCDGGRADVFCGVETDTAEADGEEVDDVGGDSILCVGVLGVEICEADEVAFGDLVHVCPGADASLAVEVAWTVWHSREFHGGTSARLGIDEVGVSGCVVW